MKKVFSLILIAMILIVAMLASCTYTPDGVRENASAARDTATASAIAVPIPQLSHFQERKTIARWAETFDTPDITCYIYLVSFGNISGYYVTNGKPSATTSYLTPEYLEEYGSSAGYKNTQLPDIDGTYGTNNSGVRFFTTSGIAVEWSGAGASYLFSTQKLPFNVQELGN